METKITLTPYLAEYLIHKFGNGPGTAIVIPDSDDLYHLIWDLMSIRPADVTPIDTGNVTIKLPDRRLGKDPQYYNYIKPRYQFLIDAKVRRLFNAELHQMLDENHAHGHLENNLNLVVRFLGSRCITSVTEDALLKNYYRWRENNRKKKRRAYKKKLNNARNHSNQTCLNVHSEGY